jgi:hypothetical protein
MFNMMKWHLETRKVKDLKPHPKNPRKLSKHDAEHLQKSMDKFGLIDKPVITAEGMIIGGHQRIALLKKKKTKEVECWVASDAMSDSDVDELCIRLNRNHGSFDWDMVANQFDMADLVCWGFQEEEFLGMDESAREVEEPEVPKKKNKICPNCGHEF